MGICPIIFAGVQLAHDSLRATALPPPVVAGAAAAGEGRHAAAPGSTACWSGFRGGLAVWSYAGACGLTRECRLFFCVRFLSLPWGGADACSRFVCGSRVGRRIRPACSPCGSEPFVVGGIPSFPPQPLPRTRFFIFFAAQYFSRAYPLPFFRRSAHLFFHVSSGQPVVCLFWCCGISAPAV